MRRRNRKDRRNETGERGIEIGGLVCRADVAYEEKMRRTCRRIKVSWNKDVSANINGEICEF